MYKVEQKGSDNLKDGITNMMLGGSKMIISECQLVVVKKS